MNIDEQQQQQKSSNEIVKFVLSSNSSSNGNPIQIEIQMPIHLQKISMSEVQTQTMITSANQISHEPDILSKEAGDEARLTGHNKYGLLSLDEYQITRTGEEHCLKKYFSDDDISLDDEMIASKEKEEETVEKRLNQMNLDDAGDAIGEFGKRRIVCDRSSNMTLVKVCRPSRHGDYAQNNSAMVDTGENVHFASRSDLLFDDTTLLSATLAQSTSSRVSHSRLPQTHRDDEEEEEEEDDDELDRLVVSTFIPSVAANHDEEALRVVTTLHDELTQLETQLPSDRQSNDEIDLVDMTKDNDSISSVRWYVRQALDSCRHNLSLVDELLERLPSSSSPSIAYEHVRQRKVRRPNCIMNIPSALKGLKYYPSSSVQTE